MNKITRFCFNFTEHLDPVKYNPKSMGLKDSKIRILLIDGTKYSC